MYDQIINDLRRLSSAAGIAGQEEITKVTVEMLSPLVDECRIDAMGNVLAVKRGRGENLQTLMLEAHLDEVGFLVTHIDDNGFVHVAKAGGPDPRTITAQEVIVYGSKPYHGVFCSVPPHLTKGEKDYLPDIAKRGIDVGLTAQEARNNIPLGSCVGFAPNFIEINERLVCGKSLDDRAGMAAILHALRQLQDAELSCNIAVAFCVQEELGCRGASPAVSSLKPDMAIVTDVSFALTPDGDPYECGKLGEGVMIGISPILNRKMTDALFSICKNHNLPYQTEVMSGRTGTDADSVTVAGVGVPTALLSIPQRYMHTPIEVVDVRDVAVVGELMATYARKVGAFNG